MLPIGLTGLWYGAGDGRGTGEAVSIRRASDAGSCIALLILRFLHNPSLVLTCLLLPIPINVLVLPARANGRLMLRDIMIHQYGTDHLRGG
jgi:hypothetical protein